MYSMIYTTKRKALAQALLSVSYFQGTQRLFYDDGKSYISLEVSKGRYMYDSKTLSMTQKEEYKIKIVDNGRCTLDLPFSSRWELENEIRHLISR